MTPLQRSGGTLTAVLRPRIQVKTERSHRLSPPRFLFTPGAKTSERTGVPSKKSDK